MGKVDDIRKTIRSLIAEEHKETHQENVSFPDIGNWSAVLYAPKYRRKGEPAKYAIIDDDKRWVASYELPPSGTITKNVGSHGGGFWVTVGDKFQNLEQAVRWVYLKTMQGDFDTQLKNNIRVSESANKKPSQDVVVMGEPMTGWGALRRYDSGANEHYWSIYDDRGKEMGILNADGSMAYKTPGKYFDSHWKTSKFRFNLKVDGVKNAARWIYLQIAKEQAEKKK